MTQMLREPVIVMTQGDLHQTSQRTTRRRMIEKLNQIQMGKLETMTNPKMVYLD